MRLPILLLGLAGCDDTVFPPPHGGGGGLPTGAGWCGVRETFAGQCVSCHSGSVTSGGLDLETDPHAAIVGVASAEVPGETLVVAGDADGSLLFRKISGTQAAGEGLTMPPGQVLDDAVLTVFREWIAAGADAECAGPTPTGGGAGTHPEGWAFPDVHGLSTKLGSDPLVADCRTCHGEQLEGGITGIACDRCHAPDWEETCTFCHGGDDNNSGAPPEDLDDRSTDLSFPAHTVHVSWTNHAAWGCETCHAKPHDALTPGHLFDDATAGVAEVSFAGGLSPAGVYDGNGSCSNLYCHGTGLEDGDAAPTDVTSCQLCHPGPDSASGWVTMSGDHALHLDGAMSCSDCHGQVVDADDAIVSPLRHVDGAVQATMPDLVWDPVARTCTGTCHDRSHTASEW